MTPRVHGISRERASLPTSHFTYTRKACMRDSASIYGQSTCSFQRIRPQSSSLLSPFVNSLISTHSIAAIMPGPRSATNGAIDMNPQTNTRQVWTDTLTSATAPSDAHPKWAAMWTASQKLMKALFDHSAMEPNRQQTFGTPANSKNSVYFMWDFVERTLVRPLAS